MWLLAFVSYPIEASISAVARGIEILEELEGVAIVSTSAWIDKVRALVEAIESVGLRARAYTEFPDPLVNPRGFSMDSASSYVKKVMSELGGEACIAVSSGSRLEVAISVAEALGQPILYVSFGWGPWNGSFYPYTPRPIEIAYLAKGARARERVEPSIVEKLGKAFEGLLGERKVPRLRRLALSTQLEMNAAIPSPLVDGYGGECPSLKIKVGTKRGSCIATASSYCDPSEVVKAVSEVGKCLLEESGKSFDSLTGSRDPVTSLATTVAEVSGILLLVDENNELFVDSLPKFRASCSEVDVDTNVVFGGLHAQLYDKPSSVRDLLLPACVDLEIYRKLVEARGREELLEATLGQLALEEVKSFGLPRDLEASSVPCEASLYVSKHSIATADRRAFERLLSSKPCAKLLRLAPISEARMEPGYELRKASYAYYAVAQLGAIAKLFKDYAKSGLHPPISIEVSLGSWRIRTP